MSLFTDHVLWWLLVLSPVSIQTQSLALASSQSWLPLLRPSIPIGWRLRLLRENFTDVTFDSPVLPT